MKVKTTVTARSEEELDIHTIMREVDKSSKYWEFIGKMFKLLKKMFRLLKILNMIESKWWIFWRDYYWCVKLIGETGEVLTHFDQSSEIDFK